MEWFVDGKMHNGSHFPLCTFTQNASHRSKESQEKRAARFFKKIRARLPRIVAVAAGRIAAVAVGAPTHQRTHHQCHHMELMLLNACQKLMEEVGDAYGRILQEVGGNGGKVLSLLTTVG